MTADHPTSTPTDDTLVEDAVEDDRRPARGDVATLQWTLSRGQARVLRASEEMLVLAAVLPRNSRPLPPQGGRLKLRWSDVDGLHERYGSVLGLSSGLLHLAPDGPSVTHQRRRFFRAPVTVDLTIHDGQRTVHGETIDLSEGGTRASIGHETLLPSTHVTTTLTVGTTRYRVPCRVVRHTPHHDGAEVGLEFGPIPASAATMIRKHVFTAQVRARSNGQHR
ncbi:hypothetical protein DVS28_a1133 [Euzebya pacifica]|uniref:PilZ domain-containing protein n=1 Tax=Euzebya pacifica TaxID=1608957 RepID=A0A346XUD6_9ACTN|nr:PilZ domain-containing protein [Euzebya pacifica]AXV05833.1 hypothetical protein DVS28_a1133 [Euzebya pacifica]